MFVLTIYFYRSRVINTLLKA